MYSVLLVEHDSDRLLFLRHSLTQCGYRVIAVSTETEARLALTQHDKFEALIVNAVLPGGHGIRLAIMAHQRHLLTMVIYGDGSAYGGRKIKVYVPGGLIYRGPVFGVGPLLDILRVAPPRGTFLGLGSREEFS